MTIRKFIDEALAITIIMIAATYPFSIALSQISLGFAVFFWLAKLISKYDTSLLMTPITIPYLLWIAGVFIAAVFGYTPVESIIGMREEWLFLTFFVVWGGIKTEIQWQRVVWLLLVSCSLSSCYALYQHFTGLDPVHHDSLLPMLHGYRAFSTLSGTLTSGAVLGLSAIFLLAQFLRSDGKSKYWLATGSTLTFVGSLLSYSRTAIVGAILALGISVVFLFRKLRWKAVVIPIALAVLTLAAEPDLFFRFEKEGPSSQDTKTYFDMKDIRWIIWGTAWRMFLAHPVTGVGHGNFMDQYDHYRTDFSTPAHGHAHNDILNIAACMGIIGLAAYLFILGRLGWLLWVQYRLKLTDGIMIAALGGIMVLCSFFLMAQFEAFFMDEETRLTLLFLVAMSFVKIRLEAARNRVDLSTQQL